MGVRAVRAGLLLAGLALSGPAWPGEAMAASVAVLPRIAVIIDDLGNLRPAADRTVALAGPVACAILPHTPYAAYVADRARAAGKEVMLHLPLQPVREVIPPGMGTIDLDTTHDQLRRILAADLASVPHVLGVNTHMGSLLTQHPGHMGWLMEELRSRGGLFFVDSYTSPASIALRLAREQGVPATRRDVFLDSDAQPAAVAREFERLKQLARQHGSAVAIGHPYTVTLSFLEQALPRLAREGYELVGVADLIRQQQEAGH